MSARQSFDIAAKVLADLAETSSRDWQDVISRVEREGLEPWQTDEVLAGLSRLWPRNQDHIERAAHLAASFYGDRADELCRLEHIQHEDIRAGFALAAHRKEVRDTMRVWYGAPEYGSWPAAAGQEMKEREAQFKREHPEWFGQSNEERKDG